MTREQARKLLESGVLQAYADGKTIEVKDALGEWSPPIGELRFDIPQEYLVRTEPKLRPWKPGEVPIPLWFRFKNNPASPCLCLGFWDGNIQYALRDSCSVITMQRLAEECEHSDDGGKTWKPCGVEE